MAFLRDLAQALRTTEKNALTRMQDGCTSRSGDEPTPMLDIEAAGEAVGRVGRLTATVLDPRTSSHIGDLFRGIFPSKPARWEEIDFGEGTLFLEHGGDFGPAVELRPGDGRGADWLKPHALYRAHEQLVKLRFIPGEASRG